MVSARIIADIVFIAFADFVPGIDAGLEYQACSGGVLTLAQLGWLIWFGLVLWAPPVENWLQQSFHGWATASLAAAGGISGAFSVIVGAGSKTTAIVQQASGLRQYLSLSTLAAVATAIFAAVLVAALSIAVDGFLVRFVGRCPKPSLLGARLGGRLRAGGCSRSGVVGHQHQSVFVAQHLSQSPRRRVSWRVSRRGRTRRDKESRHLFRQSRQSPPARVVGTGESTW